MDYTINDARREIREMIEEGYGFMAIQIFLKDLARSNDLTWAEVRVLTHELIDGKFGKVDCAVLL